VITKSEIYDYKPTYKRYKVSEKIGRRRNEKEKNEGVWICGYCGNMVPAGILIDEHADECAGIAEKKRRKIRDKVLSKEVSDLLGFKVKYGYEELNSIGPHRIGTEANFYAIVLKVDDTGARMLIRITDHSLGETGDYYKCFVPRGSLSVVRGDIIRAHRVGVWHRKSFYSHKGSSFIIFRSSDGSIRDTSAERYSWDPNDSTLLKKEQEFVPTALGNSPLQ